MKRRKNGEGSWGIKKVKGVEYKYYRKQYDGEDKYFYGKTEKEVKEKQKLFEDGRISSIPKEVAKQTFGDYLLSWLNTSKKPSIKKRTYDSYEDLVKVQIIDYKGYDLSSKQMSKLEDNMFQSYYTELAEIYSRGTIKKNYAIVKQCLDYAKTKNHIPDNYLNTVSVPSEDNVKIKKKEIQFLCEEDMDKLYEESKRVNTQGFNFGGKLGEPVYGINSLAIVFIMYTGLRIGELTALKYSDVDREKNTISIKSSISSIKDRDKESGNKYIKEITSVKTKSGVRVIGLSERAIEVLDTIEKLNPNHKENDHVFINQHGNILNRANVTRTLEAMLSRANCSINKCSLHGARHGFGSVLIKKGANIKSVSYLMGHKDVAFTYNTYIHLMEDQNMDTINLFNKDKEKV